MRIFKKIPSFVRNIINCQCDDSNPCNTVVMERNFEDYVSEN